MDKDSAILILSSLASDLRHEIYRLIASNGSRGMVAGDIASTLGRPPNNIAYHLGECLKARLVRVEREGRYQRYYADTSRTSWKLIQAILGSSSGPRRGKRVKA